MSDAPSCPISFPQATPGAPVFHRGTPWMRYGSLVDLINSIPHAHDLPSVIRSLNIMTNIISQITRGSPQVNNIKSPSEPDETIKGQDNNPNYQKYDWILESRNYEKQKIVNPDNDKQYIEIKVLTRVTFYNANTEYRLVYKGQY